jgi:PAS domain S-box-containing protein
MRRAYLAAATTVLAIAISTLLGWHFHVPILRSLVPGLTAMNPLTALCFLALGVGFLLNAGSIGGGRLARGVPTLAAFVLFVGLYRTFGYWFPQLPTIDSLLYAGQLDLEPVPNRMAPNTAWGFVLCGTAVLALTWRRPIATLASQLLVFICLFIADLALVGYQLSEKSFTELFAIPMAVNTAIAFLGAGLCVVLISGHRGPAAAFTNSEAAGKWTRQLLVACAGVPFGLGFACAYGVREELFSASFGIALLVVGVTSLLGVVLWQAGVWLLRATAMANQQRAFLDEVVNTSPNAVLVMEPSGRIVLANRAARRMLGEADLASAPGAPTLLELVRRTFEGVGSVSIPEQSLTVSNGETRWYHIECRRILDPEGAGELALIVLNDVTERKLSEDHIRESQGRLAGLSEWLNDVVWSLDARTGEMVYASNAVSKVCGVPAEDLVGRLEAWRKLIIPEDLPKADDTIQRMLSGEEVHTDIRILRPDGATRTIEWLGRPVRNDSGELIRVDGIARDVTEKRKADQELLDARDQARRADQSKSEFLSRMSHELRTPLNSMMGFAQLLQLQGVRPGQEDCLRRILKAGNHLLELINEVLDIARIEGNTFSMSKESVRVLDVAECAMEMIRPLAEQEGLQWLLDCEGMENVSVLADKQRLSQVLLNLLSNAVKYNSPAGMVRLSATVVGDKVWFEVSDSGPGLSAEQQARLFTAFDRLGADQAGVEGTGLGLSLSRRLTEAMGGTLTLAETSPLGSTFRVELDLAPTQDESLDVSRIAASGIGEIAIGTQDNWTESGVLIGRGPTTGSQDTNVSRADRQRKVLQIEDNPANMELTERIFKSVADVQLLGATHGRLGLDLAREHKPDLILLDLHLPDMHGAELLSTIRNDDDLRDIPVIVTSADATPSTIAKVEQLGVSAYLTKPFDVLQFLEAVRRVLNDADRKAA